MALLADKYYNFGGFLYLRIPSPDLGQIRSRYAAEVATSGQLGHPESPGEEAEEVDRVLGRPAVEDHREHAPLADEMSQPVQGGGLARSTRTHQEDVHALPDRPERVFRELFPADEQLAVERIVEERPAVQLGHGLTII